MDLLAWLQVLVFQWYFLIRELYIHALSRMQTLDLAKYHAAFTGRGIDILGVSTINDAELTRLGLPLGEGFCATVRDMLRG